MVAIPIQLDVRRKQQLKASFYHGQRSSRYRTSRHFLAVRDLKKVATKQKKECS
jgi:hypothetical protein